MKEREFRRRERIANRPDVRVRSAKFKLDLPLPAENNSADSWRSPYYLIAKKKLFGFFRTTTQMPEPANDQSC